MQNVPSSTDVKTCARGRCALTVNSVNNSIHSAEKTLLLVLGRSNPQDLMHEQNVVD